ncbi:phosphorylated carbohydrates phosphatase [Clostridia bacterium]|nr:phosphorylated carbohydrates phosphatase [Clostridia bacterium]
MAELNLLGTDAVLFDMDGTVLDTEPIYLYAWLAAVTKRGAKLPHDALEKAIGMNEKMLRALFAELSIDHDFYNQLYRDAQDIALEYKIKNGVSVKKGFLTFSDYLMERGVRTAIVTSTRREQAVDDLERAGIINRFDEIIAYEDAENSKPEPDPYLEAVRMLEVQAGDCLAFEDSPNGIRSAAAAGIKCVFIHDMIDLPPEARKLIMWELDSFAEAIDFMQIAI